MIGWDGGEIRILATGFGAFPGAPSNVTAALVDRLSRSARHFERSAQARLFIEKLPVVWEQTVPALQKRLDEVRPHIVLLMGLAGRRRTLSVESRAVNHQSMLRPDAHKRLARTPFVVAGGASVRRARFPVAKAAVAMRRAGAQTNPSIDAGDYLCNQALYRALECDAALVGFIHAPKPRKSKRLDSASRIDTGRPSMDAMVRAVSAVLRLLAAECRAVRS